MQDSWWCIATDGRREKVASAALQAKGVEILAPMYRERREARLVSVPLFPGYLLARSELLALRQLLAEWRLSHYLTAVGIHKLVCVAGDPSPIEPEFIDALVERIDENGFFIPPRPLAVASFDTIEPNTPVVITGGPYAGVFAKFSHMRGPERSIVLMQQFGRDCPVEVARRNVVEVATGLVEV